MKPLTKQYTNGKQGAALILAILATTILAVLAVGLVEVVRVEIIAARADFDRLQTRYLAKAGFNMARALLMYEDETPVDGPEDVWYALHEEEPLTLGEGWCRMAVIDACSRLNVNTADTEMLASFFKDPAVADAIVSWRDKYGPFRSLGELALLPGIDEEYIASYSALLTVESLESNRSIQGQPRININTADNSYMTTMLKITPGQAQAMLRYRRTLPQKVFRSRGQLLHVPLPKPVVQRIFDQITVSKTEYLSGRVNLNTAPKEVLLALPGISPQLVETLISRRSEEDGTLLSPAELLDMPGMTTEDFVALSEHVCTKSSTFIIEAHAGLDRRPATRTLQGLVLRQEGPVAPVLYGWSEKPRPVYIPISPDDRG